MKYFKCMKKYGNGIIHTHFTRLTTDHIVSSSIPCPLIHLPPHSPEGTTPWLPSVCEAYSTSTGRAMCRSFRYVHGSLGGEGSCVHAHGGMLFSCPSFAFSCVCVFVCVRMWACACTSVCSCVWRLETEVRCLPPLLSALFSKVSQVNAQLAASAGLARQLVPGVHSPLSELWSYNWATTLTWHLHGFWTFCAASTLSTDPSSAPLCSLRWGLSLA